jgi:hypothetical protein
MIKNDPNVVYFIQWLTLLSTILKLKTINGSFHIIHEYNRLNATELTSFTSLTVNISLEDKKTGDVV